MSRQIHQSTDPRSTSYRWLILPSIADAIYLWYSRQCVNAWLECAPFVFSERLPEFVCSNGKILEIHLNYCLSILRATCWLIGGQCYYLKIILQGCKENWRFYQIIKYITRAAHNIMNLNVLIFFRLQWVGTLDLRVIESDRNWMNVFTLASNLTVVTALIHQLKNVVNNNQLSQYATSAQEVYLCQHYTISTAYDPILQPSATGYNNGTVLLGRIIISRLYHCHSCYYYSLII